MFNTNAANLGCKSFRTIDTDSPGGIAFIPLDECFDGKAIVDAATVIQSSKYVCKDVESALQMYEYYRSGCNGDPDVTSTIITNSADFDCNSPGLFCLFCLICVCNNIHNFN